MQVLICCFLAILFSKRQGLFAIFYRKRLQYHRILDENILKALWKEKTCSIDLLSEKLGYTKNQIQKGMRHLRRQGLLEKNSQNLSSLGMEKAKHIVRKHRLWECYQAYSLDKDISQLHQSAEEFEHIMDAKTEEENRRDLIVPQIRSPSATHTQKEGANVSRIRIFQCGCFVFAKIFLMVLFLFHHNMMRCKSWSYFYVG